VVIAFPIIILFLPGHLRPDLAFDGPPMKITDVTVTLFAWDTVPEIAYHGIHRAAGSAHDLGLVTIATDQGVEGHAFLGKGLDPASSDAVTLIRYLKPVLLGQDPLARERLHRALHRRRRVTTFRCIGAVDVALWDIAGKVADMPIHRMLGTFRDRIPAYASSDHLPAPAAYAEEAAKYKELGWAGYKIHPPGRWREDIAIARAVRAAVGDGFALMMDSIWAYGFEEALRVGRALEELDFTWYEDPLGEHDIYGYVKLRQKLDIPIMATERPDHGLDGYAPWITAQATDYLRGDVAIKGGITAAIKTAHLAEAFGMRYEVHAGGNSLYNLANLHIEMAIPNTQFHEILLPEAAANYGVLNEIAVEADGCIAAPTGPGLGAEIDFDLIRAKTISTLK
jgi:L-alanine-DL-glutamate epimerase-like enolase superfamily enzyme